MSEDDHLWDGSGEPDPDVAKAERLLRPLGRRDDAPVRVPPAAPPRRMHIVVPLLAAVAATALLTLVLRSDDAPTAREPAVAAKGPEIRESGRPEALAVEEWVETDAAGREILVGDLGRVTLGAGSRVQVRHVSSETTRLYLAKGSLEARVAANARPRFFQVDTDAARCVDLGCRYTLDVAKDGAATVRVVTGQVAFETPTREVFVPAGASCVARKGVGPGTPRFDDARAALSSAFDALDAAVAAPADRRRELARAALDEVRGGRDTLPAWHLLQDADAAIVHDAETRLATVAGACELPANPSRTDVRVAWKKHLESRCW